jgi:hypothetical protein
MRAKDNPQSNRLETCLNVTNKQSVTRALALYTLFDHRVVQFIIFFAANISPLG